MTAGSERAVASSMSNTAITLSARASDFAAGWGWGGDRSTGAGAGAGESTQAGAPSSKVRAKDDRIARQDARARPVRKAAAHDETGTRGYKPPMALPLTARLVPSELDARFAIVDPAFAEKLTSHHTRTFETEVIEAAG